MRAAQSDQIRRRGPLSVPGLIAPGVWLAGVEVARIRGVDPQMLLAACAAAMALGGWRLARRPPRACASLLRGVAVAAVASLAVALAPLTLGAPGPASATSAVLPVLAMIACTLWLRWDVPEDPAADRSSFASPAAWRTLAFVAFAVLLVLTNRLIVGDYPEGTDEASYMLQAKWMWMPGFSWHFDPALTDFFTERHLVGRPGQLATLYPPGWPMVLAPFDAAGVGAYWGLFVGSLTLLATYRIGVLLYEPRVAALAVVLLACSQWYLDTYATYMAHGAAMACTTGAALAMLEAERAGGGRRIAWWLGAGALLSFGVASRPLTGVALGAGLVLWIWLRRSAPIGERLQQAFWLVVGALPGLAGLLYYNASTTGSPVVFGYTAAYGSTHDLGFGLRGWMVYDEALRRVPSVDPFTPGIALMRFTMMVADAAMTWVPLFALAPLLLAARHAGVRWHVRSWLPLLLLPVSYFFYFFRALRFWIEALPFAALGVAWLLVSILDRTPALGRQLVAIVLLGQVPLVVAGEGVVPYTDRPWRRYMPRSAAEVNFAAIERLREEHGKLLVFAKEVGPGFAPLLDRLIFYNGDGESGDVLVARDLGDRNAELIRRHPDRTPFLFTRTSSNGRIPATVTPLTRVP